MGAAVASGDLSTRRVRHAFGRTELNNALNLYDARYEETGEPYWLPEQTADCYSIASAHTVRAEPPGVARFR